MQKKTERLDKLLSNLGYGIRKDVRFWIAEGIISVAGAKATSPAQKVIADQVLLENKPLDHPFGLTVIYHKPVGSVCSRKEGGGLIYADFPPRWLDRKPPFSSIGRLDKNTSGLLILTDDGQLNHRITSPKQHIAKTYLVDLAEPLSGKEKNIFASGELLLESEEKACLPAELCVLGAQQASLILHEGRYHQVRRMFAAVGNHVTALCRTHIGALNLQQTGLAPGEYTSCSTEALMALIYAKTPVPEAQKR
ncbi:MAG: pseudouridine synthase [Mariprofundaceae bacterium]